MGARTTFTFITEPDQKIVLYSHWGGETKAQHFAEAVAKAEPRWDDETYCLRIMVSQLVGDYWDSETGFGLWTTEYFEESYDPITIHVRDKMITYLDRDYSFREFVEAYGA